MQNYQLTPIFPHSPSLILLPLPHPSPLYLDQLTHSIYFASTLLCIFFLHQITPSRTRSHSPTESSQRFTKLTHLHFHGRGSHTYTNGFLLRWRRRPQPHPPTLHKTPNSSSIIPCRRSQFPILPLLHNLIHLRLQLWSNERILITHHLPFTLTTTTTSFNRFQHFWSESKP